MRGPHWNISNGSTPLMEQSRIKAFILHLTVPNSESMRIIFASFPSYQSLLFTFSLGTVLSISLTPNRCPQHTKISFTYWVSRVSVLNQRKQYVLVNYRALSRLKKEKSQHAPPTRQVGGVTKQGRWLWKLRSQTATGLEALSFLYWTKPWRELKSSSVTEVVIFDCNYEILILLIP